MLSTATKMRIARTLYVILHAVRGPFGGRDEVRVFRRGVQWNLDLREGIDLTIFALGAFEWDTLRALETLVRSGATVLDVGANIGAHTLHLARLVGERGRVIAFEPTDFATSKLRANLRANPDLETRVEVHQTFLVAKAGAPIDAAVASSWPVDGAAVDNTQMGSRAMNVSGARAMTIDCVIAAAGDPDVQLIKMDVDGHELDVLEGAQILLERRRPIIVMELAPYAFHPPEKFDRMVNLLARANYAFRPLGSLRDLPADPASLRSRIPEGSSVNVVALPSPDKAKANHDRTQRAR